MKKLLMTFFLSFSSHIFAFTMEKTYQNFVLDTHNKTPVYFCKPYKIQMKEIRKNKVTGYLNIHNWNATRYDYLINTYDPFEKDEDAPTFIFEPTQSNFTCEDDILKSKTDKALLPEEKMIKKTDNVYIRFKSPTYENYNYVNESLLNFYCLSREKREINLERLMSSLVCEQWCGVGNAKKFKIAFSYVEE